MQENDANNSSSLSESHSEISLLLRQIESGDSDQKEQARRQLHAQLASSLKAVIGQKLGALVRQRIGASDIYQELMKSFFRKLDGGELELSDSDAVKALLIEWCQYKVINTRLHHQRKKRDIRLEVPPAEGGDEGDERAEEQATSCVRSPDEPASTRPYRRSLPVGPSDGRGDSIFAGKNVIELLTIGADLNDAAVAEEVYNRVKRKLSEKPLLALVFDRILASFSNEEIAEEIGITVARVRNLVSQIRARMEAIGVAPDLGDPFTEDTEGEA